MCLRERGVLACQDRIAPSGVGCDAMREVRATCVMGGVDRSPRVAIQLRHHLLFRVGCFGGLASCVPPSGFTFRDSFFYLVMSESPASVTVRTVARKCLPHAVPRSRLLPL